MNLSIKKKENRKGEEKTGEWMDGMKSNWRSKGSYASCPALFDKVSVWPVLISQQDIVTLWKERVRVYMSSIRTCVFLESMQLHQGRIEVNDWERRRESVFINV